MEPNTPKRRKEPQIYVVLSSMSVDIIMRSSYMKKTMVALLS